MSETDFGAAAATKGKAGKPRWATGDDDEAKVEAYLKAEWAKLGGRAYKWSSPGRKGVLDQLLFHPALYGKVIVIECKAPGKVPSDSQAEVLTELTEFGVTCFVVDSRERVDALMAGLKRALRL